MTPLRGLFVTGTDTGVGKTLVAAGLLRYARRLGLVPIPFKPVETGCDPEPLDALCLWRAARPPVPAGDVCLYPLRLPAAPALAAAAENRPIDARPHRRARLPAAPLSATSSSSRAPAACWSRMPAPRPPPTSPPASGCHSSSSPAPRSAPSITPPSHCAEARRRQLPIAGTILSRASETMAPHEAATPTSSPP